MKRHDLQTWHRLQHRVHPLLKVDFIQKVRFIFQISKSSIKNIPNYKADLLQLKLTPIICLMNFIKKKVGMWKLFLELMHEISFSTYLSCIENVSLNMPSVSMYTFIQWRTKLILHHRYIHQCTNSLDSYSLKVNGNLREKLLKNSWSIIPFLFGIIISNEILPHSND